MPLIRWYKLDGNAYDSSPTRDNGVATGVTYDTAYGKIGKGANFDSGRTDYVQFTTVNLTTHHTVCFWMYCHDSAPASPTGGMLLGTFNAAGDYMYALDGTRFRVNDGTSSIDWTSDPSFYNTWRHVALVFYNDGTNDQIKLYLDGVSQGDGSTTYDGTYDIDCIGACYTITSYDFDGYLNDVRIYDHKLSVKEIKEIAKAKVLHLKFQEEKDSSGDIILDSSDFGRNATLDSSLPEWIPEGKFGGSYKYTDSSEYIQLNSTEFPVTFWDEKITISFWLYYDSDTGWASFVHGSTSATWDSSYWLAVSSPTNMRFSIEGDSSNDFNPGFAVDNWYHVCATYDGSNCSVYINGVEKAGDFAQTNAITNASGIKFGLTGSGVYSIDGKMADIRIYATAFTPTQVDELYQTGASLDANGNLFCRVLQEGGNPTQSYIDYTTWTARDGSVGLFSQNGTTDENERFLAEDPWGRETLVWEAQPAGNHAADGGWNHGYFAIDNTKLYRFSVWVKRTVIGTDGRFYFGCYGYDSSYQSGVRYVSSSAGVSNPYFWASSDPPTEFDTDTWYLVVGHVHPHDYSDTSNHPDSGVYTVNGYERAISYDFKWMSTGNPWYNVDHWVYGSVWGRHRTYLYYCSDTSVRQRWCYPRVDLCDGTEPTIAQLISGNYEDPTYTGDVANMGRNGIVASPNFSEVGPADGIIGYWPMNGYLLDYSENNNDGTASGATVVDSFAPRDRLCYEFLTSTDKVELNDIIACEGDEAWSWSFWGYKASYANHGIAGHQDEYNGNPGGRMSFTAANNLTAYFRTSSSLSIGLSSSFPTSTWFHCVITHTTGGVYQVYYDGTNITTGSPTHAGAIDVNRIGDNPDNSGWISFTGHMFDFRIYNKVLTAKEINILSKMFDTDAVNRNEMSMGATEWYANGQFKEQL